MSRHSFREKVVIVTGASSGIGRALALRLAGEGALLALAARNADRLRGIASECQKQGGTEIAVPTDVADEGQCKRLVEQTVARYGRIDMLVNNAGIGVVDSFDDLPDLRLFKQVMDVNFQGVVNCAYHALTCLKKTRGRIVNVSSLAGKIALPLNTS
ncbi:MAG: SDR family NAD(P)-dependent oxidoreductase [Deltaproteobacteria bacterium]|nr:SDR family NAD(P)-dependent oxidoreductase [Deltaproteobacteria bacterium]